MILIFDLIELFFSPLVFGGISNNNVTLANGTGNFANDDAFARAFGGGSNQNSIYPARTGNSKFFKVFVSLFSFVFFSYFS